MVKWLVFLILCVCAAGVQAQTKLVNPDDLVLTIMLEETQETPFEQEMLLLTIHGIYKRHITLEKLEQPDLSGINWMQLGEDHWFESTLDGKTVKNMRRRMALFPDKNGKLTIGSFKHHLTLLDENNAWFEHTIQSDPIEFHVNPAPQTGEWWFPVRNLEVADNWSNAPDQLAKGEGVLRVIRVSALGVGPDMIPPMPELASPSALIFPHPEKRLVDLTPRGPVSIAYWRWTIQPRNDVSAILEPIEFSYFDTVQRQSQKVVISAQRVAYLAGDVAISQQLRPPQTTQLHKRLIAGSGLFAVLITLAAFFGTNNAVSIEPVKNWFIRRSLLWDLRKKSHGADLAGLRKNVHALDRLYRCSPERDALLARLDTHIFGTGAQAFEPRKFSKQFRAMLGERSEK